MSRIPGLVSEWSGFIALVFAGWILRNLVESIYQITKRRLDREHPDDLPVGGGQWLRNEAKLRKLDLRVLVHANQEDTGDAFYPSGRTVFLSHEVFAKKDPSFWAVAAHELGHALVWEKSPFFRIPFAAARVGAQSCIMLGTFLIFANVLYGLREVSSVAFALLVIGVGVYPIVLVDEAVASLIAIRILAEDPRIKPNVTRSGKVDRRRLNAVRLRLFSAYLTYLAGFAGLLLLIFERGFIVEKIEQHRHFTPGPPIGSVAFLVGGILSMFLALFAARSIVHSIRRPKATSVKEARAYRWREFIVQVARDLIAVPMIFLVWDLPYGTGFAIACIVVLLASRFVVALLVVIPLGILRVLVWIVFGVIAFGLIYSGAWIIAKLTNWQPRPQPRSDDHAPPSSEIRQTNAATDEMVVDAYNQPSWHERPAAIAFAACHLAFVIALWANLLRA